VCPEKSSDSYYLDNLKEIKLITTYTFNENQLNYCLDKPSLVPQYNRQM